MDQDDIRYDILMQEALREVVRQVLSQVMVHGLPGDHHLYIAFDTTAEGVIISKRLKAQYPDEMTVVLQYQFWDLIVTEDRFEVKLSFSNVPERLVIPFAAIKAFYDPSAQFGLQFTQPGAANDSARQHLATALPDLVSASDEGHSAVQAPEASNHDEAAGDAASSSAEGEDSSIPGAEVVQLDRFRKK